MITEEPAVDKFDYAQRCWARFSGDPLPLKRKSYVIYIAKWLLYSVRLIFVHFPGRFAILIGDLPAHDWHHLSGYIKMSSAAWPIALYERQRAINDGDFLNLQDREIWGLDRELSHVFEKLIISREK